MRTQQTSLRSLPHRPSFIDSDGNRKSIDWYGSLRRAADPVVCTPITVHRYTDPTTYSWIVGLSFRDCRGTAPFSNPKKNIVLHDTKILDEATNAVNSGLSSRSNKLPDFSSRDFVDEPGIDGATSAVVHRCHCTKLPSVDFFLVGRCLLCDQLADLLLGSKLDDTDPMTGSPSLRWAFQTFELAKNYVLMCIILTTSSADYFISLHKRARRFYKRSLRQASQVMEAGQAKKQQSSPAKHFVVGFGIGNSLAKPPHFYIMGTMDEIGMPHHQHPVVTNDFCLVVPDLGHCRESRAKEGGRKRTGGRGGSQGKAMYFRPIAPKLAPSS